MASGKFRLWGNGKFLLSPSGKFAVHSDCCCGGEGPCENCSGNQPNVAMTGTGSGDCSPDASIAFNSFTENVGGTNCLWSWGNWGDGNWFADVRYYRVTEVWNVAVTNGDAETTFINADADLSCTDGDITGTAVCTGDLTCPGDTVTITFG